MAHSGEYQEDSFQEASDVVAQPLVEDLVHGNKGKNSIIEDMEQEVQELISKINENRKKDEEFMMTFRENLWIKVSSLLEESEERLLTAYDHSMKLIQDNLQEVFENIESIREIETELRQLGSNIE
ncbi:synaptonemal complex central element protein 2-like [Anolis sagrei]|uniref:synaptonemal complex central element protein 2-like n=1 Tax=Anolis sagrei TaxID=38937 RepID=UPI00351FFFE6